MLEYQNIKSFLQKAMFQIGLKTFLRKKNNLKTLGRGHMLLVILTSKKLLEHFTRKNCKETNQKEFRVEKVIKGKGGKLYVKWKGYDIFFNSWINKKIYSINE